MKMAFGCFFLVVFCFSVFLLQFGITIVLGLFVCSIEEFCFLNRGSLTHPFETRGKAKKKKRNEFRTKQILFEDNATKTERNNEKEKRNAPTSTAGYHWVNSTTATTSHCQYCSSVTFYSINHIVSVKTCLSLFQTFRTKAKRGICIYFTFQVNVL
mmetsp:Transcript_52621/g.127504  ORF Transcript_52621/g.127504 Transcript_52621/m.127504 type:complete len:156 (+) Transcript_52621:1171-1638(+)